MRATYPRLNEAHVNPTMHATQCTLSTEIKYEILCMDAKIAFLDVSLNQKNYEMYHPTAFIAKSAKDNVYKLKRGLT